MRYDLDELNIKLSELMTTARKYTLVKKQYGIASRIIHELRAENALLRLKNSELHTIPLIKTPRVFKLGDDDPQELGLVLRSSKPHYTSSERFTIKYSNPKSQRDYYSLPQWWIGKKVYPNGTRTKASFNYWMEEYGPFTEVL